MRYSALSQRVAHLGLAITAGISLAGCSAPSRPQADLTSAVAQALCIVQFQNSGIEILPLDGPQRRQAVDLGLVSPDGRISPDMWSAVLSSLNGRVAPDGNYAAVVFPSSVVGITLSGKTLWSIPTSGPGRPAISPDGNKVAVTDNRRLLVYDIPAGRLSSWVVAGDHPDWSPDMSRLAYDHDGRVHIFDLDKGDSVTLTEGSDPSWAPGGRAVAVRSGRDTFDLVSVDTRAHSRLFEGDNTWTPRWSPDGEWMSYGASGGYRWWSLSERSVEPRQVIVRHVKSGAEAVVGMTVKGNNRDFTWAKSRALCRGVS